MPIFENRCKISLKVKTIKFLSETVTQKHRFILALAVIITFVIHHNLFFVGRPLDRDDITVIPPLLEVTSVSDYFQRIAMGKIYDVAPIRDITYFFDIWLENSFHVPTFHVSNFVFWLGLLALVYQIARTALGSKNSAALIVLIFCLHPAYVISVAWISARKHLLASIFCALATLAILKIDPKEKRTNFQILLAYFLSLFSFPILILWPLWAWAHLYLVRKYQWRETAKCLAAPLILMISSAGFFYWYYSTVFILATSGVSKFLPGQSGPGLLLLAIGRAFFNLVLPIAITPIDYYPGAFFNLIGLALFPIFIVAALRVCQWRHLVSWNAFFLMTLVFLHVKATRVFFSDTYILLPSLAIWILAFSLLSKISKNNLLAIRLLPAVLLFPAAGFSAFTSSKLSRLYLSLPDMFAYAFHIEPTPQVKLNHAKNLFEKGEFRKTSEILLPLLENGTYAVDLFALAIFYDPGISPQQKLEILIRFNFDSATFDYVLANIYAQTGDFSSATKRLSPHIKSLRLFQDRAGAAAAEFLYFAKKANREAPSLEWLRNELSYDPGQVEMFEKRRKMLFDEK